MLAVVVAGLIIGHNNPSWASGASRLQTGAVWRLVDFLLEGFVFLLIGQQLPDGHPRPGRVRHLARSSPPSPITVGVVLLLRPLWLWLTEHLPQSLHTRLTEQDLDGDGEPDDAGAARRPGRLSGREIVVLSWAGTRGVISLAAIFTLPLVTDDGSPFPDRDLLLFCAFLAVLVTLVGQGLTFAPLVRALGLRADAADQARLRNEARVGVGRGGPAPARRDGGRAARRRRRPGDRRASGRSCATRLRRYRHRLDLLDNAEAGEIPLSPEYEAALRLRRAVIDAQRERAAALARRRPAARRGPAHPGARARPRGGPAARRAAPALGRSAPRSCTVTVSPACLPIAVRTSARTGSLCVPSPSAMNELSNGCPSTLPRTFTRPRVPKNSADPGICT